AWPFAAQSLLVAAGLLLTTRIVLPARTSAPAGPARSLGKDVAEGLRWAVGHAAVRTLVLPILIFNVTFGAAWSVLVLYAQQRLHLGGAGFGLITTVSAAGGLLGTTVYGAITKRISLGNLMRIGLIIETFTHLALALTTVAWL